MSKEKKSIKHTSNKSNLYSQIPKKDREKRAKYLSKRINELYENISDWIKDLKDYFIKKNTLNIEGEKLPGIDIYSGKKLIASFKPTSLWAFGVNSRIDFISGKEINIIFDIAKENSPADWQLISSEAGKKPKEFSKIIFRNLLKKINV
ncbi:MAG TPA: hypothetical protein VLN45_07530 [Ignavibacteriaceae bacterium]|nr:hypothetical protein [Ignavibacteriaceae bacterium]